MSIRKIINISALLASVTSGIVLCARISSASLEQGMALEDQFEKTYSVRSSTILRIINSRGKIRIRGSTIDQVKVRARKVVQGAPGQINSEKLLKSSTVTMIESPDVMELVARFGKDFEIGEKVQEHFSPTVGMDLDIRAPSYMPLEIWGREGNVDIENWNSKIDVRVTAGPVKIESIKGSQVRVACSDCIVLAREIKGGVEINAGSGTVQLQSVYQGPVFVSTTSGNILLSQIAADQVLVTQSGSVQGTALIGVVKVQSIQGNAIIKGLSGSLSAIMDVGSIEASVNEWSGRDSFFIETQTGDINLRFKKNVELEVEAISTQGKVRSEFPGLQDPWKDEYGPVPDQRRLGEIGSPRSFLKLKSEKGDISLRRL